MTDEQWLTRHYAYSDDDIEYFTERVAMMLEPYPAPGEAQIQFARLEALQQLRERNEPRRIA